MIYQFIAIAALVIAIAAIFFCFHLRNRLYTYISIINEELKDHELRLKNFADAKILERKEQRHAEKEN